MSDSGSKHDGDLSKKIKDCQVTDSTSDSQEEKKIEKKENEKKESEKKESEKKESEKKESEKKESEKKESEKKESEKRKSIKEGNEYSLTNPITCVDDLLSFETPSDDTDFSDTQTSQMYFAEGRTMLEGGNIDRALSAFRLSMSQAQSNVKGKKTCDKSDFASMATACWFLGYVVFLKKNIVQAATLYRKSLQYWEKVHNEAFILFPIVNDAINLALWAIKIPSNTKLSYKYVAKLLELATRMLQKNGISGALLSKMFKRLGQVKAIVAPKLLPGPVSTFSIEMFGEDADSEESLRLYNERSTALQEANTCFEKSIECVVNNLVDDSPESEALLNAYLAYSKFLKKHEEEEILESIVEQPIKDKIKEIKTKINLISRATILKNARKELTL